MAHCIPGWRQGQHMTVSKYAGASFDNHDTVCFWFNAIWALTRTALSIHVGLCTQDRKPIRAETNHRSLRRWIYFRGVLKNRNFKRMLPLWMKRRVSDGGGYISGSDRVKNPTSSYLLLNFKCTSHLGNEMHPSLGCARDYFSLIENERGVRSGSHPWHTLLVLGNSPNDESSEILFGVTRSSACENNLS